MHIAGGLYRELCEVPAWDEEFGSGGRAAAAVSRLSPRSTLHTYAYDPNSAGITFLRTLDLEVRVHSSSCAIAFAYFHPLSRPHIEPAVDSLTQQPSHRVMGETVLRFGFLEGDAIVEADRAVYDPQTATYPEPFAANGSKAGQLALVMNEHELLSATGESDLNAAANRLMRKEGAKVVVAKGGTRGATVFDSAGIQSHVHAYRSTRVFKIGTGDVFSAIFSYYWGEMGQSPHEAADLASRSVAAYCSTRQLPLAVGVIDGLQPVGALQPGTILLRGAVGTLGQRYVLEEARFLLRSLGATVVCPDLDRGMAGSASTPVAALLVIADGMTAELHRCVRSTRTVGVPVVVLAEEHSDPLERLAGPSFTVTDDFASALYFAVWAAVPPDPSKTAV